MGGYMSAGVRQLKADPENAMAVATADFLEELPLPARLIANKFLPRLQDALDNAGTKPAEPAVKYNPGLDRRWEMAFKAILSHFKPLNSWK